MIIIRRKQYGGKRKRHTLRNILLFVVFILILSAIETRIIPEKKYEDALSLVEAGKHEEAMEIFEDLKGYKDSRTQILKIYYMEGEALRKAKDWEGAVAAFTSAGVYSDAETQIMETRYQQALYLTEKGEYRAAVDILVTMTDYKDVQRLLEDNENLKGAQDRYITFGSYPQTAYGDDSTPIEWLVLAQEGDKVLLLSRYGLDEQPYHEEYEKVTWETCSLRAWLNGEFLNTAFTEEERQCILTTSVSNDASEGLYDTQAGEDTEDKIFLLSCREAHRYLNVTEEDHENVRARVAPTEYAKAQGAYSSKSTSSGGPKTTAEGKAAGQWWLRSPGLYADNAAHVSVYGSLESMGVASSNFSVRPALWVDLSAGIFNP